MTKFQFILRVARATRKEMLARGFEYSIRDAVLGAEDAVNEYMQG